MNRVLSADIADFLRALPDGSADRIITSPPFVGLPGRADTFKLVGAIMQEAGRILAQDGTITLIVGAAPGYPFLPYDLLAMLPHPHEGMGEPLELHSVYVWDRGSTIQRRVDRQVITHDMILHLHRPHSPSKALASGSIIRTSQHGFNYGEGVTTPPDIAAFLVDAASSFGELVVDPLCGLA